MKKVLISIAVLLFLLVGCKYDNSPSTIELTEIEDSFVEIYGYYRKDKDSSFASNQDSLEFYKGNMIEYKKETGERVFSIQPTVSMIAPNVYMNEKFIAENKKDIKKIVDVSYSQTEKSITNYKIATILLLEFYGFDVEYLGSDKDLIDEVVQSLSNELKENSYGKEK